MRSAALALAAVWAGACAAPSADSTPVAPGIALANPSFEAAAESPGACAAGWYCATHAGNLSHRYRMESGGTSGRAAFCADRVLKADWALLSQHVPAEALRGKRVRLSVAMRVEAASTAPGAGPFLLAEALDSSALVHEQKLVSRTSGWQRLAVETVVPEKAWRLQVGVLFDADGTACVDDVRLEVLPPA